MKKSHIFGWGISCLTLALAMTACDTEMESVELVEPNIKAENPALYQDYLTNLKAYKNADHKKTYVWFDNSEKTPFSRAQHYTMIPDSVDFVSPIFPETLEAWELQEIAEVKDEKGTKFFLTVDYDAIKADYNTMKELDETSEPTAEEFQDFLMAAMQKTFALVKTYDGVYDGFLFKYTGKSRVHMTKTELREYTANENMFMGMVNDFRTRNANMSMAFAGKPQNVIDKSILSACETILLSDGLNATNPDQLNFFMTMAMDEGVPSNKVGIMVYSPTRDASDPERKGYITNTLFSVDVLAEWTAMAHQGITVNAMGIYGINDDYYNNNMVYYHIRKAIDTVNPSVK